MPKTNLVPIKVILPVRPNGHLDWPAFNELPTEVRQGLEWSRYIDQCGIGWHYDKVDNLGNGASHDTACTCVTEDFADAAIIAFPERVSRIDEVDFERFYDDRAHLHEETEVLDRDVLQAIRARVELEEKGVAPPPSSEILTLRQQALDPAAPQRGIRKNPRRRWADARELLGVTIHPSSRKSNN